MLSCEPAAILNRDNRDTRGGKPAPVPIRQRACVLFKDGHDASTGSRSQVPDNEPLAGRSERIERFTTQDHTAPWLSSSRSGALREAQLPLRSRSTARPLLVPTLA